MILNGISICFSTVNEAQYTNIGHFWDQMSARFGRENLQGVGYHWTGHSLDYMIAPKEGDFPGDLAIPEGGVRRDLILPDHGWITREGFTEHLGQMYGEIYRDGPLDFEIETFNDDGTCKVCYFRKTVISSALDVILERRSYRGRYCGTPVPDKDLRLIMDAGLAAPSGCNKQTTSVAAVSDPVLMEKLLKVIDPPAAATAPAGIFVLTRRICAYRDKCFAVQDYSAAIENMLLAITAMGYASCWFEGHITDDDRICDRLAAILGIPAEYELVCFLPVGIPETIPKKPVKQPNEERSFFFGIRS